MYSVPGPVQLSVFLASLGVGFLLGVCYDLFRAVRLAAGGGKAVTVAADVLYCLLFGTVSFLFILAANKGEQRGYIFAGELLGAGFYYVALAPLAIRAGNKTAAALRRCFGALARVCGAPFRLAARCFCAAAENIEKKLKKTQKNTQKIRKKLLPKTKMYVYNLFGTIFHKSGSGKAGADVSAKQAKRRKRIRPASVIVALLCVALLAYFGYLFVSTIRENNANKARLAELENVSESLQADVSALQQQKDNANEDALMEERARERGYIDPNERVYEDITPTGGN